MRSRVFFNMLIFPVLALWLFSCSCSERDEKIPLSTESEDARVLYLRADALFEKVYIAEAVNLLEEALKEDPEFFMAAYGLATHYMFLEDNREFLKYASQAVRSETTLSKGENLLKTALKLLLEDRHADVTEYGKELVKLYPHDPDAYSHLTFFQQITGDYEGQVKTLLRAVEIKDNPANIYNTLGYTYMALEQYDKAAAALDKYIQLNPDDPNPYDSKGDYYMEVKDYGKAYESFMEAVKMDSTWTGSLRKAKKASAMMKADQEK